jgi:hypothetical protein
MNEKIQVSARIFQMILFQRLQIPAFGQTAAPALLTKRQQHQNCLVPSQ